MLGAEKTPLGEDWGSGSVAGQRHARENCRLAWSCNGSFFLKSSEGVTMLFFDPKLYHIRHISGLGILKLYHIRHTSGLGPGLGSLKYTIFRNLALARTTNQFGVACITYCTTENLTLPQLLVRRNAGRHRSSSIIVVPEKRFLS